MDENRSRFVVTSEWLAERLGEVKIVDATWHWPTQRPDARTDYEAGHIPGAVFFDHEEVVDPASALPHALPSPEIFAAHAGRLGLSESDTIVVYDRPTIITAPRVWWMLRIMGARDVYVLDGGFANWQAEGRPVTSEPTAIAPTTFTPHFDAGAVTSLEGMRRYVADGDRQIADARSAPRFTAEEPEPRAGMRSGHMPGAHSVPSSSLFENGRLKDLPALRRVFAEAGVDLDKPVTTTCGSGVTAAAIMLALASLGHDDNTLYDGSWSEWGARSDTPVETGPARRGDVR